MLTCLIFDSNTLSDIGAVIQALPFGESERCRLLSLGGEHRRTESVGALVCLLRLVGGLGLDAHEIKRDKNGRPYFNAPNAVSFSLSHSEGLCIAAVTDKGDNRVGADIEVIREHGRMSELAARFFTEREQKRLSAAEDRQNEFFKIWTQKEAAAKLYGNGLASVLSGEPAPLVSHTRTVCIGERRAAISVCSQSKNEALEIFFNGEKL